jgi:hypothetical protein
MHATAISMHAYWTRRLWARARPTSPGDSLTQGLLHATTRRWPHLRSHTGTRHVVRHADEADPMRRPGSIAANGHFGVDLMDGQNGRYTREKIQSRQLIWPLTRSWSQLAAVHYRKNGFRRAPYSLSGAFYPRTANKRTVKTSLSCV